MPPKIKKILITSGPTCVPIDDMRVISNRSTGQLGQMMATALAQKGHKITLLQGPVQTSLLVKSLHIKILKFFFYNELSALLTQEVSKKYDVVIHAAAVSDYKMSCERTSKIASNKSPLNLTLIKTPKMINCIKKINPNVCLVGFKLESNLTQESVLQKVKTLFDEAQCDFVVANTLSKGAYSAYIIDQKNHILKKSKTRHELTRQLTHILS